MYQKTLKIANKDQYINKADLRYKNIKKETMIHFIRNLDKMPQPNVKETKVEFDADGNLHMMYQRTSLPLMSERDILISFALKTISEGPYAGRDLWIMSSIDNHPNYPKREKVIRMNVQKASLIW